MQREMRCHSGVVFPPIAPRMNGGATGGGSRCGGNILGLHSHSQRPRLSALCFAHRPLLNVSFRFVSFALSLIRSLVLTFAFCLCPQHHQQHHTIPPPTPNYPPKKRGDSGTMRFTDKECRPIGAKMRSSKLSFEFSVFRPAKVAY